MSLSLTASLLSVSVVLSAAVAFLVLRVHAVLWCWALSPTFFCGLCFLMFKFVPPAWLSREIPARADPMETWIHASMQEPTDFTPFECCNRCLRVVALFYFYAIPRPIEMAHNLKSMVTRKCLVHPIFGDSKVSKTRADQIGFFSAALLPVFPFLVFCFSVQQTMWPSYWLVQREAKLNEPYKRDHSLLTWLTHINFLLMSEYTVAIVIGFDRCSSASYVHIMAKDFWRAIFKACGMTIAPEVARWKDGALTWKGPLGSFDVIGKVEVGALGVGDCFFEFDKDFKNKEDVERKMIEGWERKGRPKGGILLLERIQPRQSIGSHVFDITTVCAPNGTIYVVRLTYYYSCETFTSHSAKQRVRVDAKSAVIVGKEEWYIDARGLPPRTEDLGKKLPEDVLGLCAKAKRMHEVVIKKHPAQRFISWDVMLTDAGEVWFEGNLSMLRSARFLFGNWATVVAVAQALPAPVQVPISEWTDAPW